jgi:hypothetical protein
MQAEAKVILIYLKESPQTLFYVSWVSLWLLAERAFAFLDKWVFLCLLVRLDLDVWTFRCLSRFAFWVKAMPQLRTGHSKGFSLQWNLKWSKMLCHLRKVLSHPSTSQTMIRAHLFVLRFRYLMNMKERRLGTIRVWSKLPMSMVLPSSHSRLPSQAEIPALLISFSTVDSPLLLFWSASLFYMWMKSAPCPKILSLAPTISLKLRDTFKLEDDALGVYYLSGTRRMSGASQIKDLSTLKFWFTSDDVEIWWRCVI